MRTIRIHVGQPLTVGLSLSLPPQASEHVSRVLRMNIGDRLTLFNGDGHDYLALILVSNRHAVQVRLESMQPLANESPLRLTLAQALARGEKMDLIVQKATELGVAHIVPLQTERSEVHLDTARAEKRLARWRAVVVSACEQSGRAVLPQIAPVQTLTQWLSGLTTASKRLVLMPEDGCRPRELGLTGHKDIHVVVGPEGGLGEHDVQTLRHAGFIAVHLGPRVLRTETAGLAALTALQTLYGDC